MAEAGAPKRYLPSPTRSAKRIARRVRFGKGWWRRCEPAEGWSSCIAIPHFFNPCPTGPGTSIFPTLYMFTGLIETIGTITSINRSNGISRIGVEPDAAGFSVLSGGSVSVDGACLTLEYSRGGELFFAAVQETLDRTTLGAMRPGSRVNLERPLVLGGRLDGHWVLGHVDGVGVIRSRVDGRESSVFTLEVPRQCVMLAAEKGSVAVDGISLTIANAADGCINVALIPATIRATSLGNKKAGGKVNIEADVIARYVYTLLNKKAEGGGCGKPGETLFSKMERLGF
jgi:riboflavin synthase